MNYIREINAFYDWLETNSISDSAIVLWHALMHTCNKAGWITEFAVAISTLETKTGLKKSAIQRARQRLQQVGRIDFKSRVGQQSAVYTIIPFEPIESNCGSLRVTKCSTNRITNRSTKRAQSEPQTVPINKLNKTINTSSSGNARENPKAFEIYESEGFGMLTQITAEKIIYMINDYGEPWVIDAMKETVLQGKRSLAYTDGILKRWKADGRDSARPQKKSSKKQDKQVDKTEYDQESYYWLNVGGEGR